MNCEGRRSIERGWGLRECALYFNLSWCLNSNDVNDYVQRTWKPIIRCSYCNLPDQTITYQESFCFPAGTSELLNQYETQLKTMFSGVQLLFKVHTGLGMVCFSILSLEALQSILTTLISWSPLIHRIICKLLLWISFSWTDVVFGSVYIKCVRNKTSLSLKSWFPYE